MTKHLSPEEFVDAIDGRVTPAMQSHLEACDQCRAELAETKAMAASVAAGDLSEPSPLFWDHFSSRVSEATAHVQPRNSWWSWGWRPIGAVAAVIAVAGLAFLTVPGLRIGAPAPGSGVETTIAGVPAMADEDGSFGLLVGLAGEADLTEVRQAVTPAEGTADAMIEDLTADQREALARLLQKEMGAL